MITKGITCERRGKYVISNITYERKKIREHVTRESHVEVKGKR